MTTRPAVYTYRLQQATWQVGAGTSYVVQAPSGVLYLIFIDNANDLAFIKSTDGGFTWSVATVIFAGTAIGFSIWYDRWSGISAGLIHCAYTESGTHDTLYRTIDTESSDALSTQTTIFAGASAVQSGSHISITRARGGNVYCKTCIDAGAEGGFFRLPNANVPNGAWDAALTINEALATTDQMILLPGWAADNQDIIGIFWDASAEEISRQLYDDSANSWAETSIATSMTDALASATFPHFAAAVDIANSQNVLIAWSAIDAANADLRCWTVTEAAITEKTNVVLNSTDDQGFAALAIDVSNSGHWYSFYGGKSDGSETFGNVNIYYKISKDSGATWGPESVLTPRTFDTKWLAATPRFYTAWGVAWMASIGNFHLFYAPLVAKPRANFQLGL